jgi:FlaA1/EpsC-like NDP-sugar epimerase
MPDLALLDPELAASLILNRPVKAPRPPGEELRQRRFLVTGAAGSIGRRLCVKLAEIGATGLVALDRSENGIFLLKTQLPRPYIVTLGDICEETLIAELIEQHAIDTVIHAAAYKHVPLLEEYPIEVIRNNVLGTFTVTRAAARCGVRSMLLVSTDKAANPRGLMGMTKRTAELIVSASPASGSASLRLGNVLGSDGSVWTTFTDQIAAGEPVTITHPEAVRYFLTFGETIDFIFRVLGLSASGREHRGGVFVPQMGAPVAIAEIARRAAQLLGRELTTRTIGLRPGEKLEEDLTDAGEDLVPTDDPEIDFIAPGDCCWDQIEGWLAELSESLARRNSAIAQELLCRFAARYASSSAPYLLQR